MPNDTPRSRSADAEQALIKTAVKRFRQVLDAESELRKKQLEDKKFAAGEHWPAEIRRSREEDGRPCLTIDRLKPQLKQVTNSQRKMRPAITVNAVDNSGDVETAEVLQGIIRHIETQSDADDGYDQAGRDQVEIGRGWFRILTQYADDESFDQDIRIDRVLDPFSVYPDPAAKRRDRADMRFLFVVEDVPFEEYKLRYGGTKAAQFGSLAELRAEGDETPDWFGEESIRIAEYWHVETDDDTLTAEGAEGEKPRTRTIKRKRVVCDTINALEVIQSYDWPGKYLPFVPVLGEENFIEGKLDLVGMVRGAKDPQRMTDYWKSAATETVALAPRAPFVAAEGQIEDYKAQWEQANTKNIPVLIYSPVTVGGSAAPPPARNVAEPPIQAIMVSIQASENDLRAATGFYDVGERESREQSGRAILARQKQGEHGNSDFTDGLARAIRHAGRILIDLIPKIYDTPRVLRITGRDNSQKTVQVGVGIQQPAQPQPGIDGVYDLGVGKYDVTVSAGPNYQTARQEFIEQMAPILQSQPQLMQIIGDLFFENLDVPNAKAIAERFRKMLPPNLQGDKGQQDPAVLQAQMQQMGMQMQQMQAALQQAQQIIESKQLEVASKERIAEAELALKAQIAELDAKIELQKAAYDAAVQQQKLDSENARAAMAMQREEQAQAVSMAHEQQIEQQRGARDMMIDQAQGERAMMLDREKGQREMMRDKQKAQAVKGNGKGSRTV